MWYLIALTHVIKASMHAECVCMVGSLTLPMTVAGQQPTCMDERKTAAGMGQCTCYSCPFHPGHELVSGCYPTANAETVCSLVYRRLQVKRNSEFSWE